jgi:hypothetical protein
MFGCGSGFRRCFGEELSHGGGYLRNVGFDGEVSRVQKLNGSIGVIARVGLCAGWNEEWVVLAPDGQQRPHFLELFSQLPVW